MKGKKKLRENIVPSFKIITKRLLKHCGVFNAPHWLEVWRAGEKSLKSNRTPGLATAQRALADAETRGWGSTLHRFRTRGNVSPNILTTRFIQPLFGSLTSHFVSLFWSFTRFTMQGATDHRRTRRWSHHICSNPTRYHCKNNPYPYPNDEEEHARLAVLHSVVKSFFGNNILAPLSQKPLQILDIGAGSGLLLLLKDII
jgi:hypothetical protein